MVETSGLEPPTPCLQTQVLREALTCGYADDAGPL